MAVSNNNPVGGVPPPTSGSLGQVREEKERDSVDSLDTREDGEAVRSEDALGAVDGDGGRGSGGGSGSGDGEPGADTYARIEAHNIKRKPTKTGAGRENVGEVPQHGGGLRAHRNSEAFQLHPASKMPGSPVAATYERNTRAEGRVAYKLAFATPDWHHGVAGVCDAGKMTKLGSQTPIAICPEQSIGPTDAPGNVAATKDLCSFDLQEVSSRRNAVNACGGFEGFSMARHNRQKQTAVRFNFA